MIKKIDFGNTQFNNLYQVFGYKQKEEFDSKKARLFPTTNTENEIATTSIFLASLSAVKEYREELFLEIGINKIKTRNVEVHSFTELCNDTKEDRPDGLIVITSGKHNPIIEWACFVETKLKDNKLEENQIERYIDFARSIGIDSIITISNQLVTNPYQTPLKIKKRGFDLYHWSWSYLKVLALRLIRTDSIKDEDHIFILKELRRYFDAHKNMKNFINMGKDWKDSVNLVHSYSLGQKINKDTLDNIINAYIQEEKDISLQLTDKTDFHIELLVQNEHENKLIESIQSKKILTSTFIINKEKKNLFSIDIDFIRQQIRCYTYLNIENKGKAQAQTTYVLKMFENISGTMDSIFLNAYYKRNKSKEIRKSLQDLLDEKMENKFYSILDKDLGDEVKSFELIIEENLGRDFQSTKNFIIKLESIASKFLSQIMANLK